MNSENKKTILLVEDQVIIAMSEKMTLQKYGYSVIMVTSGEKAIEAAPGQPILIDKHPFK